MNLWLVTWVSTNEKGFTNLVTNCCPLGVILCVCVCLLVRCSVFCTTLCCVAPRSLFLSPPPPSLCLCLCLSSLWYFFFFFCFRFQCLFFTPQLFLKIFFWFEIESFLLSDVVLFEAKLEIADRLDTIDGRTWAAPALSRFCFTPSLLHLFSTSACTSFSFILVQFACSFFSSLVFFWADSSIAFSLILFDNFLLGFHAVFVCESCWCGRKATLKL